MSLTPHQQKVLDLYLEHGDKQKVADLLGLSRSTVRHVLLAAERKGAAPWFSPAQTPEHLDRVKTTVQYGPDGQVLNEWARFVPNAQHMQDFVDGLCQQVKGRGKVRVRSARKTDSDDLLFELDIYDAHVGMFADEKETRDEDYDCGIAAARMVAAAEGLASRARRPKKCVLVFGGDMMHSDTRQNRTEQSGHVLDVDTRYQRVVEYMIRASKDVVRIAASIAEEVELVIVEGNHSWHSEVWLAQVLAAYYHDCPNIKVMISRSPRKMMTFGSNLLVWAHGDKIPAHKWPMLIAAEFAEEWGRTKYRHLKMGHIHHKKTIAPVTVDEQSGLLVEYLEALCPSDAWHANAGFIGSQRGASAFEYHRDLGLITRFFQPV